MKKTLIQLSLGLLCVSFAPVPAAEPTGSTNEAAIVSPNKKVFSKVDADVIYNTCKLDQLGLSEEAFKTAYDGYNYLLERNKIGKQKYLTICDFSQSSLKKRLYIIDIANQEVITNTYVAHGKNSGVEYATSFSNKPESLQSSLGFYITSNTYTGKHGLSLRLNGVDPGFNDKALERTIVMHGADYVSAARARSGGFMGRSWGCPAVSNEESKEIINTIKEGSCLFVYHPSRNYLLTSKILNP